MILGPHIIGNPGALDDMLKTTHPGAILYLDPSDRVPYLAPITVGRYWYDVPVQATMLANPHAEGAKLAERCIAASQQNGITIWQGLNEPPVGDPESVRRLCQFERARVERLEAAGLAAAVLALSVGWPAENMETRQLYNEWYAPLMEWLPRKHYVMFHQYWRPTGPLAAESYDPWAPSLVDRQRYWRWPHNIIIGECGIDVAGQPGHGWKAHCPPYMNLEAWCDIYIQQIRDFHRLLKTDSRVKAGLVYTMGQFGWWAFEIADHWRQFEPLFAETAKEDEPVPEQRIRVLTEDGSIADMAMEQHLRGVLPAEMFPSWDAEALRAGAVWARTYNQYANLHPRHGADGADVCIKTHCHAYDVDRIRPSTDRAVADTAGVVMKRGGAVFEAEYVSKCGRADCPYCLGLPGYMNEDNPDGLWPGRGCQWGSQTMAVGGHTWQEICTLYYGDVTFETV